METHRPRKRFGQHFLHDPQVIERIQQAIHPSPDDVIIEIGPGEGVLTKRLAGQCHQLHVVEIDRDLARRLREVYADDEAVVIHEQDVLDFDFCALTDQRSPVRVVGNLPYNISTPILFHCLRQLPCIRDMHFMLQKEVIDRLAAPPGTKTYGRLSVVAQLLCEVDSLFDVGPGAFRPPPKVWSSVVRLTPRSKPLIEMDKVVAMEQLTHTLFSQRRKTLRRILSHRLTTEQMQAIGIDAMRRPETLALDEFIKLATILGNSA